MYNLPAVRFPLANTVIIGVGKHREDGSWKKVSYSRVVNINFREFPTESSRVIFLCND